MANIVIIDEINEGNLFLRKVSKDDISFFYNSLNNNKEMTNFLSLGPLRSLEHSRRLIKNYLKSWDKYLQFNYVIELRDDKSKIRIGSASLWNISWFHNRSGVGIWILPEYWEKGLGKRVIQLVKNIAFNHLNLNRIEAIIAVKNERSIKMFKNSNFEEEGILRKYLNIDGKFCDALILSSFKI